MMRPGKGFIMENALRPRLRTTTRGAAALAGAAIVALASAATAEAATRIYHGADWAEATTTCMRAYDGERDGNGVYADAYLVNGAHPSVWDGNGSDGNAGPWGCQSSSIKQFRVCEDHVGCSAWRYYPS